MKVGDLVMMDFEAIDNFGGGDVWGIGMIVTVEDRTPDDVEVLWPGVGLSWEMTALLEAVDESR